MRRTYTLAIAVFAVASIARAGTVTLETDKNADERLLVNLNVDQTWMEFVGQVVNPNAATSNQPISFTISYGPRRSPAARIEIVLGSSGHFTDRESSRS